MSRSVLFIVRNRAEVGPWTKTQRRFDRLVASGLVVSCEAVRQKHQYLIATWNLRQQSRLAGRSIESQTDSHHGGTTLAAVHYRGLLLVQRLSDITFCSCSFIIPLINAVHSVQCVTILQYYGALGNTAAVLKFVESGRI